MDLKAIVISVFSRDHEPKETEKLIVKLFGLDVPKDDHGHFYKQAGAKCPHGARSALRSDGKSDKINKPGGERAYSGVRRKPNKRKPSAKPVTAREMKILTEALNTNLTKEQFENGFAQFDYGGHRYTVLINGFDDYKVIRKVGLDESAEYYDKHIYSKRKGGGAGGSAGKKPKKKT